MPKRCAIGIGVLVCVLVQLAIVNPAYGKPLTDVEKLFEGFMQNVNKMVANEDTQSKIETIRSQCQNSVSGKKSTNLTCLHEIIVLQL